MALVMAVQRNFSRFSISMGNLRSLFNRGSKIPISSSQKITAPKQSLEEKLGLPKRPKKPLTPYLRFLSQVRPSLVQQNPNAKFTDIVRLGAQHWERLDEKSKQDLNVQYKKEIQGYTSHLKEYEDNLTAEQKELISKAKEQIKVAKEKRITKQKQKDLGKPKRPVTPFAAFVKLKAPHRGTQSFKEWQMEVTQEWKDKPDAEKLKYTESYKKASEVYKKELKNWEEKMIRLGNFDVVRAQTLLEPTKSKKLGSTENNKKQADV